MLYHSSDNNSFNTSTVYNLSAYHDAYGIYLDSSSDNSFSSGSISDINAPTWWDFYSDASSHGNSAGNITISSYPTTISFTYDNGIMLKSVQTPPADPGGKRNIRKYVNVTNITADSWIFLNVSYEEGDLGGVDENSLRMWKHNGTDWTEVPGTNGVNTAENYVYANITEFSVFAPLGNPTVNCTCGDICVNETGWWPDGGAFNASNTPIQHAIDNATAGETICVKDGTYTENVDVDKRLTIKSENGYAATIVTASNPSDHVFYVTGATDWVNISGLTVTNATGNERAGIYINGADHCNISDNNASGNYYGIYVGWSSYNIVDNNTVTDNDCAGILIESGCFLGGTKILLADSSYKNIEDVAVGDLVQSYDEAKKEMATGKVLKTFYHEKTDYYLVINEKLRLTPNHPMYVNNEWKEAGDIKIGDLLLDKDGNYVAVTSIEKIDESVPVYNLEVSGYHNYFAADILTHNKCPRIFSYNGTGYQFDVLINVWYVGPEEDWLFEYPLKYLKEPKIRVEYDPKEINYIDFIKLIIEDTTEQEQEGLQNKTYLLDPKSCSGTDFDCNLSLLAERDGQYLISDVDHKEFFLEFEDFPELEPGYNRTIKIFSSGYQIILDGADFSCECEQVEGVCEFLDEYFSGHNSNSYDNRYGNANSYNTISNNEVSWQRFSRQLLRYRVHG